MAMGTDTGGSIRIPASFCGIVGLKPTLERVSRAGATPLSWTLDSVGPLTRTVEDTALVFDAIAGPDQNDPVTLHQPLANVADALKQDVNGMRAGFVRDPFCGGADDVVVKSLEDAAKVLEDLGVDVIEWAFPEAREELDEELDGYGSSMIMPVEGYTCHRDFIAQHGKQMDPRIKSRIENGASFSATDYASGLQKRETLRRLAVDTLRDIDVAICPTMLTGAPRIADVDIAPVRLTTRLVNFLGLCAVSVPCGWSDEELPIGLQIIGKPFDEARILRLAHAYEQAVGTRNPSGF